MRDRASPSYDRAPEDDLTPATAQLGVTAEVSTPALTPEPRPVEDAPVLGAPLDLPDSPVLGDLVDLPDSADVLSAYGDLSVGDRVLLYHSASGRFRAKKGGKQFQPYTFLGYVEGSDRAIIFNGVFSFTESRELVMRADPPSPVLGDDALTHAKVRMTSP